ncbi:MAG: DUF3108 domain-containing protein [Bacteroidia bacterium]
MSLLIEEAGMITDGSKIVFWISDDANKIPLRIESDLAIGSSEGRSGRDAEFVESFDALVE